jgi:hypothetical protein
MSDGLIGFIVIRGEISEVVSRNSVVF